MTDLLFGLLAFAAFLVLWVVAPHRVINRRRAADGQEARRVVLEGQRLPHYWFQATGGPAVPVFARSGAYVARIRGGPEIAGPTLAAVKEKLCAYLERTDLHVQAGEASDHIMDRRPLA